LKKIAPLIFSLIALMCSTLVMAADQATPVIRSKSHTQCPWQLPGPVTKVFANSEQWHATMAMSEAAALGGVVDWGANEVIVFGLKPQPNLGVSVALQPPVLHRQVGKAHIQVKITQPAPGAFILSVVSIPCVMLIVSKQPWRELEVRDSDKKTVLSLLKR
jgi:hypothetical protein